MIRALLLFVGMVAMASSMPGMPEGDSSASSVDPEVMKNGRIQFIVCAACHGQNGEGTGAGPPLAGSEWVLGPVENLIRIQLRGLRGPIVVKGVTYDFPAGMTALAYQNDAQIAAVLTYMRNSFGNNAPAVKPEQVAALRGEVGMPPVTVADLILPPGMVAAAADPPPPSDVYDDLEASSSLPKWIALGAVLVLAGGIGWYLKRGS